MYTHVQGMFTHALEQGHICVLIFNRSGALVRHLSY